LGLSTDSNSKQKTFDLSLRLPLNGKEDRAAKRWLSEFKDFRQVLRGYVEGYCDGDVELLLYPGCFAVVLFHVVPPRTWVPIPLGFVTEDQALVGRIEQSMKDYLSQPTGHEGVNDLGRIADL
jgi:hypothetical protein